MSRLIYLVVGAGAIGLAVASSMWLGSDPPPAAFTPVADPASDRPDWHTVYVSGAVASPGLVAVPAGSRVADAVAAAGGALPGAAHGVLNYAAPVQDGQHVHVPEEGGLGTAAVTSGPISINSASESQLQDLPGVGPVLARRIVEFRQLNGPYETAEDLLDVPGIGEAKLASFRDHVAVP